MDPIPKLQEDLKNPDPHFVQNAVIGLAKYFENEEARNKLTEDEKAVIVSQLIEHLGPKEDSVEVKGRIVKVFKSISIYLKDAEIIQIFTSIINYITDPKATGKDIYVDCIKSILEKVPGSFYETIGKIIVPPLIKGLDSEVPEIKILCLDTLNDYITKFDYELINKKYKDFNLEAQKIVEVALHNITSSNDLLKANSIKIIGTVSKLLTKKEVCDTTGKILDSIKNSQTILEKKNFILALKSLGRTSSHSQLDQLKELMDFLFSFLNEDFLDSEGDYDEKNDLVEATLNCIEIYVGTSLFHIKDQLTNIIENAIKLIKYDPGNTNDVENVPIEGYGKYEDLDMDANLDDSSWKVRRASARILETILGSGFNLQSEQKEKIINTLIECFKEQEENAKLEIIKCLNQYLDSLLLIKENQGQLEFVKTQSSIMNDFIPKVSEQLISIILKDLQGNSKVIKNSSLKLLPTLAKVSPEGVIRCFDKLKQGIEEACFDSNENTLTLMEFLKQLFQKFDIDYEYKSIYNIIIDYLRKGMANSYYKVSTTAIEASSLLFPILNQDEEINKVSIMTLYNDILPKFKMQDIDFEIKITTSKAIATFITVCGGLLKENEINELIKIYISKINNELIRPEILKVLNDIVQDKNEIGLKLDSSVSEIIKPLLPLLETSSQQNQIKILTLLETIFKKYPNALKSSIEETVKILLNLKIQKRLILYVYNILKNMLPLLDESLINKILDHIESIFSESSIDNSFLSSIFEFARLAYQKIPKNTLNEKVKKYSPKMKELNENISYYFSIIICNSGEEKKFLEDVLNQLSSLSDQKEIETMLNLIGNICENSKENHDELLDKLEKLKSSLGINSSDAISEIIGKIGANNPIGFVNKLISQKQDNDSHVALKEFLNLIKKRNINVTDANMNGLIDWLLKTPKLEEEKINKHVGSCIGLVVSLNKELIDSYIQLVKSNTEFKKSALLSGAKEILKTRKNLPEKTLKGLYDIILEGIKDKERLIKEHSLQALNSLQTNYTLDLRNFYLKEDIRKIIHQSCRIDPAFVREINFGSDKIMEDKGVGIRKAALDIETFMIDAYPNKLILGESIPLIFDCLLDTEKYLKDMAFRDLTKIAKFNSGAFSPFGGLFIDTLFKLWKTSNLEEFKRYFSINVKNIFEELKDVESITGNARYGMVVEEINKH